MTTTKTLFLLFICLIINNITAQVGIGTLTPNISSKLDITSTNKGLLIPRINLSNTIIAAPIVTPVESLLVWNTNAAMINGNGVGYYYWDGLKWISLISSSTYTTLVTPHNTLDKAYDQGALPGDGRKINADSGSVEINGTDGLRVTGFINSGQALGNTTGVQMFFLPRSAAFRAGSGNYTTANVGSYSVAMGLNNTASGQSSLALVNGSRALAESCVAIGNGARAVQQDDMALGQGALANGKSATAIGESAEATGISSIAIGSAAHSIGDTSIALGKSCQAEGLNSTAVGNGSQAISDESMAMGISVRTDSFRETALGTNNTNSAGNSTAWVATDRLLSVGNGTTAVPSNAMVILKNGNVGIGSDNPKSKLQVVGLPIYADNATALTGGLTVGAFYHNGDGIVRVVF